jgi:CBS domain containing-hemolysin-like protein
MAVGLIAALVLVLANGFFVATEFAVTRLRPTQVEDLVRQGRPGAKSAKHAVEHIDAYLSACQLGITVSSLGLGALGEPAFHDLLEPLLGDDTRIFSIGLATIVGFTIITTLHVVVGELSPKSLAIARTEPTSLILAPLMRGFYLVTKPVVDLFNGMGNLLLKPFGVPPASEAGSQPHSEDELRTLLRQSSEQGLIAVEEQRVTEAALLYGDRRAREVMKPRPEVVHLTTDQDLAEAGRLVVETGHTRFPLCASDGGLDAASGVVNAKDLLQAYVEGRDTTLSEVSRPIMHVSEAALIDELLRDMRRRRMHIAVVVDEHGTATGLVTIEDLLEEIVGEIEDEFDTDHDPLVRREDGAWLVDGQADLHTLANQLGLEIEDHHEATISGHLLEKLGRIPEVGETLEIEGRSVEVTRVGEARIDQLRVPVESPESEHPSG